MNDNDKIVDALQGIVICMNDQNHLLKEIRDKLNAMSSDTNYITGALDRLKDTIGSDMSGYIGGLR